MTLRPVLVAVALTTAVTALSTPAAHAGDPGPAAVATIQTVDPAVPAAGGNLVLAGTVVNTGDELLSDVNAILRFSAIPLDDRVDVRRVATDDDLEWGQRDAPTYFHEVDPGAGTRRDGGVHALDSGRRDQLRRCRRVRHRRRHPGDPPGDGERLTLATTRTVVPWLPMPERWQRCQ